MISLTDLVTFVTCVTPTITTHFLQWFVTSPHFFPHSFLVECDLALFLVTVTTHCLLVWLEDCDVGVVAGGDVLVGTLQH